MLDCHLLAQGGVVQAVQAAKSAVTLGRWSDLLGDEMAMEAADLALRQCVCIVALRSCWNLMLLLHSRDCRRATPPLSFLPALALVAATHMSKKDIFG